MLKLIDDFLDWMPDISEERYWLHMCIAAMLGVSIGSVWTAL